MNTHTHPHGYTRTCARVLVHTAYSVGGHGAHAKAGQAGRQTGAGRVGWLVIDGYPKIVYNLNTTLMEVIRLRGRLQHNTPEHDGQGLADAGLPRDPRQPQEQDDAHDVLECRHKHP